MNIVKSGSFFKRKNKYWELEISTDYKVDIKFLIEYTTKGDHNGFTFLVEVYRFSFSFKIYDIRHWDWENNKYVED